MILFNLWKIKAQVLGMLLYFKIKKKNLNMKTGACATNGTGDLEKLLKLGSQVARVPFEEAIEFSNIKQNIDYILLMQGGNNADILANNIEFIISRSKRKPLSILINNEENDASDTLAKEVRSKLNITIPIIRGSHTAVCESGGLKIYYEYLHGEKKLDYFWLPHCFHYYEHPSWENKLLSNMSRRYYLCYIISEMRKMGRDIFIIDEFHAGGFKRPGINEECGGEICHDSMDYASMIDFFDKLGIKYCMYYQAAYLGEKGNDILGNDVSI